MFKDYTEDGIHIPGYETEGLSLGARVDLAVDGQRKLILEQYKGRGIHVSSEGRDKEKVAQENQRKMDLTIRSIVQTVYDAAESEILKFIRSGAEVIGRFPNLRYYCFTLTVGGHEYMDYFDYLREPEIVTRLRADAEAAYQSERERGGIVRRVFFLLMTMLAFFVTLSWEGVQQFAKYNELVTGLMPAPIVERGFSCLVFLLCLLPYIVSDFRYRERNSRYALWIPTGVQLYFFITSLIYTLIRPIDSRGMNFMVEGILWGAYCFGIFFLSELWRLWKALGSRRRYKRDFQNGEAELQTTQRLLAFYRTWWKAAGKNGMHPAIVKMQEVLDALREQYKLWS